MKVAVFAYSRQGCNTARRVMDYFAGQDVAFYTMERFDQPGAMPICRPSKPFYGPIFQQVDAMVFVGSVGIAVREIAPHVKSKTTDPAVVSIDELGHFVVPLLSGHIGGANDLALALGKALGAQTVITTATDINHRFSVDSWAVKNNLVIASLDRAKKVAAAILEGDVPLKSDYPIVTELPKGVVLGDRGDVGIRITITQDEPFDKTLRLIPRIVHLGIGCRRGTEEKTISQAVEQVLAAHHIDRRSICQVATIDLKGQEPGLLDFCQRWKLPLKHYSAETLAAVPGMFTPSEFVKQTTGVDNVCERAAMVNAWERIVDKTAWQGVTVAFAVEKWEVHFG